MRHILNLTLSLKWLRVNIIMFKVADFSLYIYMKYRSARAHTFRTERPVSNSSMSTTEIKLALLT